MYSDGKKVNEKRSRFVGYTVSLIIAGNEAVRKNGVGAHITDARREHWE